MFIVVLRYISMINVDEILLPVNLLYSVILYGVYINIYHCFQSNDKN